MKKSFYSIIVLLSLHMFMANVNAMCPEEQGLQIAQAMQASVSGWGDIQSDMEMIIRSPNGKENKMALESKMLEVEGDGDKSLILFKLPQSVAGVKLLSHSHIKADDEQWTFMPKTKKINQIGGKAKSGSFLGSQFSFEDLSSFKIEKYRFRYLRDEKCDIEQCSVLAIYPEYKGSGYSKMVSWIDKQSRVQKIEYYDREDELLKTLTINEYKKIDDKYWQPVSSEMKNNQNNKTTELVISNIRLKTGLQSRDFDKSVLK